MMRKKNLIWLAPLFIGFFGGYFLFGVSPVKTIIIGEKQFQVEVADTPKQRALGLGGRENLCEDCGMLFDFEKEGEYVFWMKDMRFDLDIIWIRNRKIVYIAKNVSFSSPEILRPDVLSDSVLEINAGLSERYNFRVGDMVE